MPLVDRARPSRIGERFEIILEAAVGYNNAMRGREITLAQACELCAFLSTQLTIVEVELADEKRGRQGAGPISHPELQADGGRDSGYAKAVWVDAPIGSSRRTKPPA